MRSMSLVLAMLASAVFGILMAPSSPRAADVDRVQRACALLTKDTVPVSLFAARQAYQHAHQIGINTHVAATALIDARLYQVFCK